VLKYLLIVYDSKTGNTQRFINKLNLKSVKITEDLVIEEPFVLVTHTTGIGQIPQTTLKFLEKNYQYLKGVACSGNKVWGKNYGAACDLISKKYGVPILMKFELSGSKSDVEKFHQEVNKLVKSDSKMD